METYYKKLKVMIERFIRIQVTDIVKLNFSAAAVKCTFHLGKLMQYSQVNILYVYIQDRFQYFPSNGLGKMLFFNCGRTLSYRATLYK
jgi:hypothetical protein